MIIASPTYDAGLFPQTEDFLRHLKHKNYQNRKIGIIENGSWAPMAAKCMQDILKDMKAKVSMSVNTLDEKFVKCCENTTPVKKRLQALKKLHDKGIYTILCISPIFPYITDYEEIIEKAKGFVDEYWFENLNLRQSYKTTILDFIERNYSELYPKYKEIYMDKNREYWFFLKHNIMQYCKKNKFNYKIDFRHS